MDCSVCCEPFSSKNRKVVCKHCNYECCSDCNKRYILSIVNEAKCMNPICGKVWDREYLISIFSYAFVNTEYKKHREDLLYDLEIAKLQETQLVIEHRKKIQNKISEISLFVFNQIEENCKIEIERRRGDLVYSKKLHEYQLKKRQLEKIDVQYKCASEQVCHYEEVAKYTNLISEHRNKLTPTFTHAKLRALKDELYTLRHGEQIKKTTIKYFGHCPENECKGFITNSWNCGLCGTVVCKSCKIKLASSELDEKQLKEIKDTHECSTEDLNSIHEIKKMTKPCPKCKVPIFRISGCAQIWCTECHIAFDWNTGEVVTNGVIHNPHYIEWLRRTGGTETNIVEGCGRRRVPRRDMEKLTTNLSPKNNVEYGEFARIMNHIRYHEMNNLNNKINKDKWLEYRILFMTNVITEKQFKQRLQWREKELQKQREHGMIFDMAENAYQEYKIQLVKRNNIGVVLPIEAETFYEFKKIIEDLITYTNESFLKLKGKYKNKVPQILKEEKESRSYNYSSRDNVLYHPYYVTKV
jgi:hypothetical protein